MPKLQLYIAKSLRGYKSLVNFNPEEDVRRHIGDFRSALDGVDYDASKVNIFHLLCYREQGVMITVIRTIPENAGDHLAASLFVPSNLLITSAELLNMLSDLAQRLSAPAIEASGVAELRASFAKDYPKCEPTGAKVDSDGRLYAFARTGHGSPTMQDYAAEGFYTPAFGEYAGVLLVPATIECTGTDATPNNLPPLISLNPPENIENGFVPHIYRHIFNQPYLVPKGEPVDIVWRRGGFENVVQTVTPTDSESARKAPKTAEATKTITPASFYITSQRTQEPIAGAVVRVNGCEIKGPVNFTYSELEHAAVEIVAKGYFTFSGKLDLATTTQALVQMKELRKIYRFELPVMTPEPEECVRFTIQSKKELGECPIEGYAVSGDGLAEGISRSNTLLYVGGRSRRSFMLLIAAAVAGIAIGFVAGWLSFGFNTHENVQAEAMEIAMTTQPQAEPTTFGDAAPADPAPVEESPADQPQAQPEHDATPAATPDYAAAKAYLDCNRTWNAEELEAIPGMQGFFNDLNTYNFDRIKNHWAPLLDGSANFAILLRAVEGSASKPDPRRDAHNPNYNREGDTSIGWRGYTYWIDP